MVQIGKYKQGIMEEGVHRNPYLSEQGRLVVFWKTLFAGQPAKYEARITPMTPLDWQWTAPTLTTLESARLEYAEVRSMTEEFIRSLPQFNTSFSNNPPGNRNISMMWDLSDTFLADGFLFQKMVILGLRCPTLEKGTELPDVPFILRRTRSAFQVVGESYLHGLMEGQAIEQWRLGTREVQSIVLV